LYWSGESHLLFTVYHQRFTLKRQREELGSHPPVRGAQPSAQPQVRLSLLHSISLMIGAHGLLRTTLYVLIPSSVELLVQKYKE
jgi:hypothetical protein